MIDPKQHSKDFEKKTNRWTLGLRDRPPTVATGWHVNVTAPKNPAKALKMELILKPQQTEGSSELSA